MTQRARRPFILAAILAGGGLRGVPPAAAQALGSAGSLGLPGSFIGAAAGGSLSFPAVLGGLSAPGALPSVPMSLLPLLDSPSFAAGVLDGRGAEPVYDLDLVGSGSAAVRPDAPDVGRAAPVDLAARIKQASAFAKPFQEEFNRHIVDHPEVGTALLMALLAGGNVLLDGLPGSAKTRAVLVFARLLELTAGRIQFTRDTQPFDITGQEEKDRKTDEWVIRIGPGLEFHITLYDEVNRTKGQTLSGAMQLMEEGHATIAGKRVDAPFPRMAAATENPIEEDGVYPLPKAIKDRFMFFVQVPYLGEDGIVRMLDVVLNEGQEPEVRQVATKQQILDAIDLVRQVKVSQEVKRYIARVIVNTRPDKTKVDSVKKWVRYGASDRAAKVLARAAQAHAFLQGRAAVLPEDVAAVAHWVMTHRIILNFNGESNTTTQSIIGEVLTSTPQVVAR